MRIFAMLFEDFAKFAKRRCRGPAPRMLIRTRKSAGQRHYMVRRAAYGDLLESKEGCDSFDLVADRICERRNSTVGETGTAPIGGARRIHVGEDLELIAQSHRRLVLDSHRSGALSSAG